MESNPLVSIVIPCYNHEKFIEETILSVCQSTYSTIEIIVVNDGSSDRSEEVVKTLQKQFPYLKYFSQKNAGSAAARNNGIRQSEGKFILPLDADDLISCDYIENGVKMLINNSDVKLVYCEAEFFGERSGKWKLPSYSPKLLARENMIFCSAMYRKEDWERLGGYAEEMTWGWEDWEFWIALLKNGGDVVRLPITGFFYRVSNGSRRKSTNKDAKRKTVDLINQKHYDFLLEQLQGPLHYQRSCSVFLNRMHNIFSKREL